LPVTERPDSKRIVSTIRQTEVISIKARLLIVGVTALALLGPGAFAGSRVVKGKAVYYADSLKGHGMACGGTYQPGKMVAAHRSLPCGTKLRVKNKDNGKVVTVTVKDRGPYGEKSTVLDLSRKAARMLGYVDDGSAPVRAVVKD
jgi:peptidoglycan lytic transglycosylase